MAGPTYARRTARVVLLDSTGRVLLFRCYLTPDLPSETGWFTPGRRGGRRWPPRATG